jgi:hypothetical protein
VKRFAGLNTQQRKNLASFFNSLAVAWFVGAFVVPYINFEFTWLILLKYIVNIIADLTISHLLLLEVKNE